MIYEETWILNWFEHRGSVPGDTLEERLRVNYFEADLVDSFGVIELIADVESHFTIIFSDSHFQDRDFSTIGGLSNMVAHLSNAERPRESADDR